MKLVVLGHNIRFDQEKLLVVMFLFLTFLLFLLPHSDTDFGWHYRCGYELLYLHKPCIDNTFSYFLMDYKWAYSTFLYDAALAITFDFGGFLAVSILGASISTLIIYAILKTMRGEILIKIVLILLATYLSWQTLALGFRSQFMTLLFLFVEIYLLLDNGSLAINIKGRQRRIKWLFFIPILSLIWANTHTGVFMGPVIFAIFITGAIYRVLTSRSNIRCLARLALAFFTTIIATLINPFGYKIYLEIYHHMQIPMSTLIAEWVPPNQYQILLIISLTFAYIIKHIFSNNYKKYNLFFLLMIILTAYLGITARRNLPIFYYTFAIAVSFEISDFKFLRKFRQNISDASLLLIFSAILSFGSTNIFKTVLFSKNRDNLCEIGREDFLCEQIDFFKDKTGNMYNTYEWGGYLIWKLPNMKVFADGRMPAWRGEDGKSPYTTWLEITQAQPGWDTKLNKYGTDYLLINNGTFLDLLLRENPQKYNYKEAQRDSQGVIYEHTTSEVDLL